MCAPRVGIRPTVTAGIPSCGTRRCGWRSEMRVALVVAACLLLEAIIAKNVLDVRLDAFTQLGALWVWLAYTLGGRRDRAAELTAMAAAVVATAVILIVYAF